MQEIEANELYAYFYATDIIAADPNFPTQLDQAITTLDMVQTTFKKHLKLKRC